MNANQLRSSAQTVQPANRNRQRPLTLGPILALALILSLNAGGVAAQKSGTPLDSSRHTAPSRMNDHLYVPCSVSGCVAPSLINDHLYVPCSVGRCNRTH